MANISLGGITFRQNPTDMTVIRPQKSCADVQTLESVAFFSWGVSIVGLNVEIDFDYMEADEFDDYDDLYAADAPVVFDPQDNRSSPQPTYNVEIKSLDSKYHMSLGFSSAEYRKDVKFVLLIQSEV